MKRFFMAALAVALLASSAQAANVASITEDFTTKTSAVASVFNNKSSGVANRETPTAALSPNGFKWGGWCQGPTPPENNANHQILFNGQGAPNYVPSVSVLNVKPSATKAGSYVYTIFDSTGGGNPTSTVTNLASITLKSAAANASTEATQCTMGLLLRDTAGTWYKQMDNFATFNLTENVENDHVIAVAGKNFQALTGAAPTDMNEMDPGVDVNDFTPGPLDSLSGTNVSAPADITGCGYFLASDATVVTGVKVKSVTITGSLAAAPGVAVTVNSNPVADGETVAVALGSYEVAETAADVTFTVSNPGALPLTVSGITVPTGVIIVEDLTAGDIAPAGSDTFIVKVDTTAEATISGEISFTTNVTGAETFNFAVSGNVGPVSAVREWEQY